MKLKLKKIFLCILSAMTLIPATGNVKAVLAPMGYYRPAIDRRALGEAIRNGNLPYVINFFQNSGLGVNDVTDIGYDGQTPIQEAAYHGQLNIVDWLARHGADIDATNEPDYGLNPLTYAAMESNWDVVRYLVLRGADVNAVTHEDPAAEIGHTALTRASREGNLEIVHLLVTHGADVNIDFEDRYNALEGAVAFNHLDVARYLIEFAHAQGDINYLIELAQEKNATEVANYLRQLRRAQSYIIQDSLNGIRHLIENEHFNVNIHYLLQLANRSHATEIINYLLRLQQARLVNAIALNNLNAVRYLIEREHIDVRPDIDRLIQIAQGRNATETANYLRQLQQQLIMVLRNHR